MKTYMKVTILFTLLFLSSHMSFAADSFQQCLNQTSAAVEQETNTQKITNAYKRCISQFKKQATYSQCAQTMKSLKHKDMMYICATVRQNGSLAECLKASSEVYEPLSNRLAGFAFKACVDNFKTNATYTECVDNIKSSKHSDNIHVCNVITKDGTYAQCLQENITAFKDAQEQRRVLLAYRGCTDAFRSTGNYELCYEILNSNKQNHLRDVCRTLPKAERLSEIQDEQGVE